MMQFGLCRAIELFGAAVVRPLGSAQTANRGETR